MKRKYYTVWRGHQPGVYHTWAECEKQVKHFPAAQYKSFPTLEEAENAFLQSPHLHIITGKKEKPSTNTSTDTDQVLQQLTFNEAIAVDAACSKNPGAMEYRGVHLPSGKLLFHFGPVYGTNNIGEFLAIVHALAYLEKHQRHMPIFSDSRNALNWIRNKHCKTQLVHNTKTATIHQLIQRAENWLHTHTYNTPILKWDTSNWGEIPADFGRK